MNVSDNDSDRYKIQIFSGDKTGTNEALRHFNKAFTSWRVIDVYEPPNYKVWAGNFRNRLEADRGLILIQKEFPDAFRVKPKRNIKNKG
ncbi:MULTISPECIES: hypothetical protein [Bizionia]|uniref:hypothetical protein n=1 Tax=Bizionia TaxID=283785 RepID=UPI000AB1CB7D|nr:MULTISPECIES: hypothetical protein [Bizionia]